jgi:hypothetical protein
MPILPAHLPPQPETPQKKPDDWRDIASTLQEAKHGVHLGGVMTRPMDIRPPVSPVEFLEEKMIHSTADAVKIAAAICLSIFALTILFFSWQSEPPAAMFTNTGGSTYGIPEDDQRQ